MTYKTYYLKISKAITNLSASVDLEEPFYVQDDAAVLQSLVTSLESKLKNPEKIISLNDFSYRDQCFILLDEARFFLAEAYEFLG